MKLAEVRKEWRYTQEQLAMLVGVHRSLIGQIERGFIRPYPKIRRKLAAVLKTPEQELFGE